MRWFALCRKDRTLYVVEFSEENLKTLEDARKLTHQVIKEELGEEIKLIGIYSECLFIQKLDEEV